MMPTYYDNPRQVIAAVAEFDGHGEPENFAAAIVNILSWMDACAAFLEVVGADTTFGEDLNEFVNFAASLVDEARDLQATKLEHIGTDPDSPDDYGIHLVTGDIFQVRESVEIICRLMLDRPQGKGAADACQE